MDDIIELNKELYECFSEFAKICDLSNEETYASFLSTSLRCGVLSTFLERCSTLEGPLKEVFEEKIGRYFEIEDQLQIEINEKKAMLGRYEDSIASFYNNRVSEDDLGNLFNCLREAYDNFKQNNFANSFTFYSEEMTDTLYRGRTVDLSISEKKLPHLLGVPNPNKKDKKLSLIFSQYLKEQSGTTLLEFLLSNDGEEYLRDALFIMDEDDKKELCSELGKIFSKCINFRKVYEFKFIPEIVFDYSAPENKEIIKNKVKIGNEYGYQLGSNAFRKIYPEGCWTLKELRDSFDELDEKSQSIIRKIEGVMDISENETDDKVREKVIIAKPGKNASMNEIGNKAFVFRHIDEDYQYTVKDGNISNDMQPNLWLLSYDVDKTKVELLHSEAMLLKSITIYVLLALDKMGIDFFELNGNGKIDLASVLSMSENNYYMADGNYSEKLEGMLNSYFGNRDRNTESNGDYGVNIADIKRNHLLNPDLITGIVDSLTAIDIFNVLDLDDLIDPTELLFINFDEASKKTVNNAVRQRLDEYYGILNSTNDGKDAYNDFLVNISTLLKYKDCNSVFEQFNLYVVEPELVSRNSNKGKYDSMIPISTFLPLAQHLKMKFFEENGRSENYDFSVGAVGYSFNEDNEEYRSKLHIISFC